MKKSSAPTCKPKTAVAYARYSSAGQRDVSIEQQLADIRAYAKREGYTLVHEYADHAKSGFKNPSARTAFQTMLKAAESGGFDTVISWKVDRFGRDREQSALFKGRLRRFGVRVIYAMEPIPEGSAGVLLEGMLEATAEWYSRQLSENVIRGLHDNANKCMYNGARILGYSVSPDHHYIINPEEAATVRHIFQQYRGGHSAAAIARDLNAKGLLTTYGKPYSPQRILKIISNEQYTGVYIWSTIRIPGGMPAIITEEEFEEAQKMRGKTSRHIEQGAVEFLLTGRCFCGHCGASMVGDSGTSKTGERHYYYSCQGHKTHKTCKKKSVQKEHLESLVIDHILDHVLSEPQINAVAESVMEIYKKTLETSPLASMESEYAETQKKIENINNAIAAGVWSSSTVTILKSLEETAETLRQEIETMKYSHAQLVDRDRVLFFLRRFKKCDRTDPAARRHIIETFVNSVYVYDDHVKLVVNNTENPELFKIPPGSDIDTDSLPTVSHPNTYVTVYRLAM